MTISPEWRAGIDAYLAAQRAAGMLPNTIYARRQHLEHLARRVDVGPWELTGSQLVDYAGAQLWARETRRGRRNTFESFWIWAIAAELVSSSPVDVIAEVKAGEPNPSPCPDDVYLEALIRADEDERLWIDLAADHGLRRAEISMIHSSDLVPTLLGYDVNVRGKGGKRRLVPLTSSMARALLERGPGWLFPGDDDGHVSPRWLGTRVNRLLSGEWTIHKLRHRAATRFWIVSDGDPYAVAELMGWANLNMVRVYVRQPNNRLRNIVEGAARRELSLSGVA